MGILIPERLVDSTRVSMHVPSRHAIAHSRSRPAHQPEHCSRRSSASVARAQPKMGWRPNNAKANHCANAQYGSPEMQRQGLGWRQKLCLSSPLLASGASCRRMQCGSDVIFSVRGDMMWVDRASCSAPVWLAHTCIFPDPSPTSREIVNELFTSTNRLLQSSILGCPTRVLPGQHCNASVHTDYQDYLFTTQSRQQP